jgi:hypothetical protein
MFPNISRYKMVNGSAEDLILWRAAAHHNGIQQLSKVELSRGGVNTFFPNDCGALMVVIEVAGSDCQCRSLRSNEIVYLYIDYVRVRVRNYRLGLTAC